MRRIQICEVAACDTLTSPRKGTPAKRCDHHLAVGTCEVCGVETRRAPGVTRGKVPRFCSEAHRYQAEKARRTPEQVEEIRRRSREACRVDMRCLDCGDLIPRRDDGLRRDIRCAACKPVHHSQRKARDWRNRKLRQYGITAEQYDAMLEAQGGGCAFCGTNRAHPTQEHEFYIDHDHACCPRKTRSCGQCVRFLLCHQCNIGLGNFRDDPAILRAAADAIERHAPRKRHLAAAS